LKLVGDDSDVTVDGGLFQTRDAAAVKERSPGVKPELVMGWVHPWVGLGWVET